MDRELLENQIVLLQERSALAILVVEHLKQRYQVYTYFEAFLESCQELGVEYHVEYVGTESGRERYASAVIFHSEGPLGHRKDKVFPRFSSEQAALHSIVHHWISLMAGGYMLPVFQNQ